ncbi:hypothetical protein [Cucumibacter marinus]|uniref:hypothetical protein n=1 Tax=Cucumibacter marinus TaxID=1121252 RepID=UPI00041ABB7A|nr:hypothetical protein [Cucumibacter marinus]
MTYLFYLLGWICVLVGVAWSALIFGQPLRPDATGYAILGRLIAVTPGASVIFGGFLLLAIGGVLHRLDKIVDNSAETSDLLERVVSGAKR